jgi:hypothetical protein
MTRLPCFTVILALSGCGSTPDPVIIPKDAGPDDAAPPAPSCSPLDATLSDAGPPGTFAGKPGAHCARDVDCAVGTYCVVVTETCASPANLEGPGQGGHLPGGSRSSHGTKRS